MKIKKEFTADWINLLVSYLTPEPEVLHFGFKIPHVSYLWPVLTVDKEQKKNTFSVHSAFSKHVQTGLNSHPSFSRTTNKALQ